MDELLLPSPFNELAALLVLAATVGFAGMQDAADQATDLMASGASPVRVGAELDERITA